MTHQSPKVAYARVRVYTGKKFPGPVRHLNTIKALRPEIASPGSVTPAALGTSKLRGRTALSPVMRVIRHGGAEVFEPDEHGAL